MKRLPVRKTAFSVMRKGLLIAGTRYAPEQNGSNVPIIISHGFLSTRKNMAGYAKTLAKWGYTVYTFDFIGGAPKNDSDGTMTEMSVLTEKEDLIAVMNYVHRDGFHSKPILVGFSQGGFVSAMVAAEHRNEVQKLILFYPALCIPDDARRGRMQSFRFDPANVPELISVPGRRMTIGSRYVLDAQPLDAYACISAYHGDVLLLHGTSDRIVDISYSERARQNFSGRAWLYPIANAGHGFWGDSRKQAMAVVYQFLSGREEVLRVDVRLSEIRKVRNGISSTWTIPFTGSAKGKYFNGSILPGAADIQKRRWTRPVEFCARYTIEGKDCEGQFCRVSIVNRTMDGTHWIPEVKTDSTALAFLNQAVCEAILENRKDGLCVHIFASVPR